MNIRLAKNTDAKRILELLSQVLEIHAAIRPDIFVSGTTKYTKKELEEIIADPLKPIYVAEDESGILGYCFCQIKTTPPKETLVPMKSIFIDDLCVDEKARNKHVGHSLFDYVKEEAKRQGCYEIALNVWEGNDSARAFYDRLGMKPKETQMEFIL